MCARDLGRAGGESASSCELVFFALALPLNAKNAVILNRIVSLTTIVGRGSQKAHNKPWLSNSFTASHLVDDAKSNPDRTGTQLAIAAEGDKLLVQFFDMLLA